MKHLMPQHSSLRNVVILLFALVIILLANFQAYAQIQLDLTIDEIFDEDFPHVKTYVSLTDGQGYPVTGLQLDNFSILESGKIPSDMEVTSVYQKPIAIAIVIDISRSMGYGPAPHSLDLIIQAANEFMDTLAPEDVVAVIAFSDDVTVVEQPTSDKSKVKAALNSLAPLENAALNDAILDSVGQIKNFSGQKVLVLFTDGPESGLSEYTFDQALDEAVRQKVHVYSAGWRSSNQVELEKLANLTNGSFYKLPGDLPDLAAFRTVFSALQNNLPALREQYLINFTSSVTADRGEHTFVVKADHLGGSAEDIGRFVAYSADVTISLPELFDGQVIGGKIRFAPQVQAASPLAEMDLTMDGQVLASRITQPFEYILDSANVAPGEHNFTLAVRDTSGNTGEYSLSLMIEPPLMIEIISPINGASLSEETLISAEVRGFSPITRVEFELDGSLLETVNASPYEMLWNPATVPAGGHKLRARVYDSSGYEASQEINLTVALKEQSGMLWIIALAALATAGIVIPLASRSRRRLSRSQLDSKDQGILPNLESAEVISNAYLSEIEGNSPGEKWSLTSAETRLGRKRDENDIPLKGLGASRRHALIKLEDGRHIIVSLNPENPILINDQPAMQQVLNNGDIIRAGDTAFIYEQL
jgi:VWFA-related protein